MTSNKVSAKNFASNRFPVAVGFFPFMLVGEATLTASSVLTLINVSGDQASLGVSHWESPRKPLTLCTFRQKLFI